MSDTVEITNLELRIAWKKRAISEKVMQLEEMKTKVEIFEEHIKKDCDRLTDLRVQLKDYQDE